MKLEQTAVTAEKKVVLPFIPTKEYEVESLGELQPKPVYDFAKRCCDIALSAFLLLLLAIPMCIIALLVVITSPGPALYSQERLGKDGKKIMICKFRTMISNSEAEVIRWSYDEDPRVTPLGSFLRKYHIDELPQLWDILRGVLSFVGPRPEREVFYDAFEEYIHGFHERLKVKPGLTGLAQITGGGLMPPEEKIVCDIEYIKNRSLWMDLKLMVKTVAVVLSGRF